MTKLDENWYFGLDPESTQKYKCIQKSHSEILRMTPKKRDRIIWTGYCDESGKYHRLTSLSAMLTDGQKTN